MNKIDNFNELIQFSKYELMAECDQRQIAYTDGATKGELAGRILQVNLREKLNDLRIQDAANAHVNTNLNESDKERAPPDDGPSTNDLLRMMFKLLERQSAPTQILTQPDLSTTLPKFSDNGDESLQEWIADHEAMRLKYNWDDATLLAIAGRNLEGPARDWNESAGRQIRVWKDWLDELRTQFGLDQTLLQWSKRCESRNQRPDELLPDYMHAKMRILSRCPLTLRERDKVDYLTMGITDKATANSLKAQFKATTCTCYELIELARELEPTPRTPPQTSVPKAYTPKISTDQIRDTPHRGIMKTDAKPVKCFRCNTFGHMGRDHDDPIKAKSLPPVTRPLKPKPDKKEMTTTKQKVTTLACAVHPTIIYETVSKHPRRPVAIVTIDNDQQLEALVDSGADDTVLRFRDAKRLNLIIEPFNEQPFRLIDDEVVPLSRVTINVTFAGITGQVRAEVVLDPPYPVLLGLDWKAATNSAITTGPGPRIVVEQFAKGTDIDDAYEHKKACTFIRDDTYVADNTNVNETADYSNDAAHIKQNCIFIRDSVSLEPKIKPSTANTKAERIWINSIQNNDLVELKQQLMIQRVNGEGDKYDMEAFLNELPKHITPDATMLQINELRDVLLENRELFTKHKFDIGFCPTTEHTIELTDNIPIKVTSFRHSWKDREFIKEETENWLKMGLIRKSKSPYASPVFVVEQPFHPSTPRRLVVDYRRLNGKTVKRIYAMPRIDDTTDKIGKGKYFTTIDIKKGFLNIRIREEDRHKTAFTTPDGHYECIMMNFGYCGAPATWTELMDEVIGELKWNDVIAVYMDDSCIYTGTVDENIAVIRETLGRFRQYGFKVDLRRCQWIQREVTFLGYVISSEGKTPDPSRSSAVERYPNVMKTKKDIQRFLGFASYFRKFIKNFSQIAQPLIELTKTQLTNNISHLWTPRHAESVRILKSKLRAPPILAHFDPKLESHVYVDASIAAFGAYLAQKHEDGRERAVEFASKTTSDAERKLHSNHLECLAVHWALTEKFRIYVVGLETINVWTDNWAVSHLTSAKQLNKRFARIALDLQNFPIVIRHKSGKSNVVADALSRPPDTTVCTILTAENSRLAIAQKTDGELQRIVDTLNDRSLKTKKAQQIRDEFFLETGGILCRRSKNQFGMERNQIVIPTSLRKGVLKLFHDSEGHTDKSRTKTRIEYKYWWPEMNKFIKEYVTGCAVCQRMNRRTSKPVGFLHPRPIPKEPFSTISMDHAGPLPTTKEGNKHIVIAIDHATRTIVTQAVSSTATKFITDFINDRIFEFNIPLTIVSDQGSGYTSKEMKKFLERIGIEHVTSCPYFPQANGLAERAVQTVKSTLRKYANERPNDWDQFLAKVTRSINTSKQGSTKVSPFYLLHGYEPRTEGEIEFGVITEDVERLLQIELLHEIREESQKRLEESLVAQKKRYDKGRINSKLMEGEYVLLIEQPRTPLGDRYKPQPYRIRSRRENDTCDIELPNGEGRRTVHITQLRSFADNEGIAYDQYGLKRIFAKQHEIGKSSNAVTNVVPNVDVTTNKDDIFKVPNETEPTPLEVEDIITASRLKRKTKRPKKLDDFILEFEEDEKQTRDESETEKGRVRDNLIVR